MSIDYCSLRRMLEPLTDQQQHQRRQAVFDPMLTTPFIGAREGYGDRPSGGQLETPSSNGILRLCRIDATIRQAPMAATSSMRTVVSACNSRSHAAQFSALTAPWPTTSSVAANTARSVGPNPSYPCQSRTASRSSGG